MSRPPHASKSAIADLLDSGLLSGHYEVSTVLRPERVARPVACDDLPGVRREIERASQVWGGGSQPLLPVVDQSFGEVYDRLLRVEQIDYVGGLQAIDVACPARVRSRPPWDHPAIAVAAHKPLSQWRTVNVAELDDVDPWRLIYAAILGIWPAVPDAGLSELAGLREDLRFEEIVPVARESATGSLADLLGRLEQREFLSPRDVSNVSLSSGMELDLTFLGTDDGVLPNPRATRRSAGPNLIVAVSPDSVEDIALLWNLRGAHGGSRILPIGVPVEQITSETLKELQQPGRASLFGLGGGACHLVSASVSLTGLRRMAEMSTTVKAVPYEDVLTFGPAPGRHRSHISSWIAGSSLLSPISDADDEVLKVSRSIMRQPELLLDVRVDGYPIPTDPTMRGNRRSWRFQAGRAQVAVSESRDTQTVSVAWPSGWTCLAAVAKSRGLEAKASAPGLAAATLIRTLGGVDEIWRLLHAPLIALLYRTAERSGMTWWKKRWADTHTRLVASGTDADTLEQLASELGRDEPVVASAGEGRAIAFHEFVEAMGRNEDAASRWVAWAERHQVLVRGAYIDCPDCKARSWLVMAALPPPIPCAGCGQSIEQPYGPRDLRFTYRLGEPLRRVLETDSLDHVFALRWFVHLFGKSLVGAHPGVSFNDPIDPGRTIGEADVILLFTDGTVVPIEVKRRLGGATGRTAGLMDQLADALEAPWDALVVAQPAREVETLRNAGRRLPERPRLVLTNDQIHDQDVRWLMGRDPFAWIARTLDEDDIREGEFVRAVAMDDPESQRDRVGDFLLHGELDD